MAKFNLEKIVGHVSDHPLLEPNRFEVVITGPVPLSQSIMLNCHRCSIPSHSIGSFEMSTVGPKRNIPNGEIYDNISISFYNSHHLDEIIAIDRWMTLIGGQEKMRIAYYNDIVSDMQINIYNLKEEKMAEVKILEAYPIGVSELELSYAGELPSDITVNFAYHSFEIWRAN